MMRLSPSGTRIGLVSLTIHLAQGVTLADQPYEYTSMLE
jgi:hypothetical protein